MKLSKLLNYEEDEDELINNCDITRLLYKKFRLNIWSNKEIVLDIIKQDGYYFKYVHEKLKKDKEIVYKALSNYNRGYNDIFDYVDEELKKDKEFILELIEKGYITIYPSINEELKKDRDYTLARRCKEVNNEQKAIVFISKSIDYPRPLAEGAIRVDKYRCQSVFYSTHQTQIKSTISYNRNSACDLPGLSYVSIFCDDTKVALPSSVIDLLSKHAEKTVPGSMNKLFLFSKNLDKK
jgi:hypothetical protein